MTTAEIVITDNGNDYDNIEDLSTYFGDVIETLEKLMVDAQSMTIKLELTINATKR